MSSQAVAVPHALVRLAAANALGRSVLARNSAVRRMLAAAFISSCGDRLHQVALAAVILATTGSLVSAGLVFVVSTLPYVLFGLPVGALVDRWDRRTAMVTADLTRAVLVLGLPVLAFINLPLVYPLLFVVTCATMVFNPARQAAVPDLVEADDLPTTNIFFQVVTYSVDLAIMPLAGLLVAACTAAFGVQSGALTVFGIDALSYVVSGLLLIGLPLRSAPRLQSAWSVREVLSSAAEGLRYLIGDVELRTNTALLTVAPLLLGSLHTLWIGFAWRVTDTQIFGYATIETTNAAGTLLGLWLLPLALRRVRPGHSILLGFTIMGGAIALAGTSQSLPLVACLAAVSGIGNMFFLVPSITFVQRRTPAELRGRVFSVRMTLTYGAFALSNFIAGALSDSLGVSVLLTLLGGGMIALALVGACCRSARDI